MKHAPPTLTIHRTTLQKFLTCFGLSTPPRLQTDGTWRCHDSYGYLTLSCSVRWISALVFTICMQQSFLMKTYCRISDICLRRAESLYWHNNGLHLLPWCKNHYVHLSSLHSSGASAIKSTTVD